MGSGAISKTRFDGRTRRQSEPRTGRGSDPASSSAYCTNMTAKVPSFCSGGRVGLNFNYVGPITHTLPTLTSA